MALKWMSLGRTHQTSLSVNKKSGCNPFKKSEMRNTFLAFGWWMASYIPSPENFEITTCAPRSEKKNKETTNLNVWHIFQFPKYIDHKDPPIVGKYTIAYTLSVSGLWEHPTSLIRSSPFFCVTQVASSCLLQWQLYFASEREVANPPKGHFLESKKWGLVALLVTPPRSWTASLPLKFLNFIKLHKGWKISYWGCR